MSETTDDAGPTVYDRVGGQPFFDALVDRFYDGVEQDAVLRPMYPPEDMAGARHRLAGFLAQYWGGPPAYSEARGHPRLRMRHNPFVIGEVERQHWLAHMLGAVEAAGLSAEVEGQMVEYFEMAARAMVNSPMRFAGPGPGDA
jgi:hemoglobin